MYFRTKLAAAAAGALLAASFSIVSAHAAVSAAATGTIKNGATQFCLDSNTKGEVYAAADCNGGNFQNWIYSGDTGTIENAATGLLLDSNTDGKVYTMGRNGGNFQNWSKG